MTNQAANSIILNANGSFLNAGTTGFFVDPIRNVSNANTLLYNTSTKEITYGPGVAGLGITGPTGIGSLVVYNTGNTAVYYNDILKVNANNTQLDISGNVIPVTNNVYTLGSTGNTWKDVYVGPGTVYIGNSTLSATGATGPVGQNNMYTNANFAPTVNNTATLGVTGLRWKDIYIGPGSINIAGPAGSSAVGLIGTNINSIVYTPNGFATPYINIGPNINENFPQGNQQGWQIYGTGPTGQIFTDLVAQQIFTGGTGPTGPVYSLISGKTGSTGPTGPAGTNGVSGGLVYFLDTAGGSANTTPVQGTLLLTPNTTAQTTITKTNLTGTSFGVIGYFYTQLATDTPLVSGLWDLNIYANTGANNDVGQFYAVIYYSSGVPGTTPPPTGATQLATGAGNPTFVQGTSVIQYTNSVYVASSTTIPATNYLSIYLYGARSSGGGNITMTEYFRDSTLTHIHTTLLANYGPTGPTGPTNASTISITNNQTPTGFYVPFVSGTGPNQSMYIDGSTPLQYNPVENLLTVNALALNNTFYSITSFSGGTLTITVSSTNSQSSQEFFWTPTSIVGSVTTLNIVNPRANGIYRIYITNSTGASFSINGASNLVGCKCSYNNPQTIAGGSTWIMKIQITNSYNAVSLENFL